MELNLVNTRPAFAPPQFRATPTSGYLHLGAAVAPPTGPPFVRPDARRSALLAQLAELAAEVERLDTVRRASLYRAVLVPPIGTARYDVAMLVETSAPEALADVQASVPVAKVRAALDEVATDVHVMAARCVRSLGEVDRTRQGLFLFNHFTAADPAIALPLWEHLAGWYAARTGLDNSTLLAPVEPDDYVLVNHARWDKGPLRLAVEQFARPSFHRYVRANLRAHDVVAMPVLYRLAGPR